MIIIKLQGGLGNQMFQYALGRFFELKKGQNVFFDDSHYENHRDRKLELNDFNVRLHLAKKEDIAHFMKYKRGKKRIDILLNPLFADEKKYFFEKKIGFDNEVIKNNDDRYLDGYWQSPKYFEEAEEDLKNELSLKEPFTEEFRHNLENIQTTESVSLHVRRGDYTESKNQKVFHSCSPEYYKKSIDLIAKKIGNIQLFIFSDDNDWVRKNISFSFPATFVSNKKLTANEEVILMSICKHNITANSTFSWWGAWLNKNKNKIVVTPKKWYVDEKVDESSLIPDGWIRL